MARERITKAMIEAIQPTGQVYELWDSIVPGLLVRVTASGAPVWYFAYRIHGQRKRYKLDDARRMTPEKARQAAQDAAESVRRGIDPQAEKRKAKEQTLGALIDGPYKRRVLDHRNSGEHTYRRLKNCFSQWWNHPIETITQAKVDKWRSEKKASGATKNRDIAALKAVLSFAETDGLIAAHPLAKLKPFKEDKTGHVRFLFDDERQRLLAALVARETRQRKARDSHNEWLKDRGLAAAPALDGEFTDYLRPMVLVALGTGMRRGELFNLLWQDVDLRPGQETVTVRGEGAKSGKTRHIPIDGDTAKVFRQWQESSGARIGLVFPSPQTGKRLDNVKKAWVKVLADAKIKNFRFHDLRHDYASRLAMGGASLAAIRELLGHASADMVLRYAHLSDDAKRKAVVSALGTSTGASGIACHL